MVDNPSLQRAYEESARQLCLSPEYLMYSAQRDFRAFRRKLIFRSFFFWAPKHGQKKAERDGVHEQSAINFRSLLSFRELKNLWLREYPCVAVEDNPIVEVAPIDSGHRTHELKRIFVKMEILRSLGREALLPQPKLCETGSSLQANLTGACREDVPQRGSTSPCSLAKQREARLDDQGCAYV